VSGRPPAAERAGVSADVFVDAMDIEGKKPAAA
jgi:hypothetical protein